MSYVGTVRKQEVNPFKTVLLALSGEPKVSWAELGTSNQLRGGGLKMVTELCRLYRVPVLGKVCQLINSCLGCEVSTKVQIGKNVSFVHNSVGTVIHENTIIKDNVKIYQNVTVGRGNIWEEPFSDFDGFVIEEGAVLCAGAKIIGSHGKMVVGKNTIIGANAVLTRSTGENEIWGGYQRPLLE